VRETLYIHLSAVDPSAPTAYCIARADAVASFPIEQAPLESLPSLAQGRRVVVLLPSADIRLTSVQLPARQLAKVQQAVPYILEDQLADDVETLHFAVGARRADGQWPVAVIARERLAAALAFFVDRGLRPEAMIPDLLCLPTPGEEQFTLLVDGDGVLVRSGWSGGFTCQREDLDLCLQLADPERVRALRVIVPRNQSFDPSTLGRTVEPVHGFAQPLEALLQNLRMDEAINLLQGEFSARQDLLRLWRPWRAAAALAAATLLVAGSLHGIEAWKLGVELATLETQNRQRFQQLFPAETRIVNLEAQLDQQLGRLAGGAGGGDLLTLMNVIADAVGAVPGLRLDAVQYRDAALYASMSAGSLQSLEQLKAWFDSPRPARLEVQSANSGQQGVQLRIKLTAA
jgi:general secretion pathway protein L